MSENMRESEQEQARGDAYFRRAQRKKAWRYIRPVLIVCISAGLCALCLWAGIKVVLRTFVYPVDSGDATPITVTVERGSGASSIAKTLYEACGAGEEGLIRSKAAFKIYVDFTGRSNTLQAGTYVLSKNMDISQIVDVICLGNPPRQTVKFTIPEGLSAEEIAEKLSKEGILKDPAAFLQLCKTGEEFKEYNFIEAVRTGGDAAQRDYALEGYLFPDTYEIYADSSPKTIITKMLLRFNEVFSDEYIARAQELSLTVDDVVTLASIIEQEAKAPDFNRVSAVFHNRINKNMRLQSDAPLKYIFKTVGVLDFTAAQLQSDSPYNTYTHDGLPVGAICNPGEAAIQAALYPDEAFLSDGYLYFVLKSHTSTELVFAKTNEAHEANKKFYQQSPAAVPGADAQANG
ncbi:MAG: endolytic transglycosylase MltG [Christensenellaceae bacterium]|jgi:UPF0755 protein|nr:endolytic transglycosylase MltG [Christensenellaceae bacterium]